MSALLKYLRTRFSNGFVLAFHDIEAERLTGLIESIHPAQAIPLSEMVDRSKRGKTTRGLFAITVDDGVGDTVRSLSQLFCERGWPATFYLSTNYVDSTEGMGFQWWRNLLPLLPLRKIELKSGVIDLSRPGAVRNLSRKMEAMWHSERLEKYFALTLELAEIVTREYGFSMESIRPPAPITWGEVAALSQDDLIRFESHGVTHAAMSTLTDEELIFEMKHSREVISSHTGQACRHLAYPFGSERSIGARAATIAQQFYDSAATMTLGSVDAAHPWLLPRIPLYAENPIWFANLKVLLKCNGLSRLPGAGAGAALPVQSGAAWR